MHRFIGLMAVALLAAEMLCAQPTPSKELTTLLSNYFLNYPIGFTTGPNKCSLTGVQIDESAKSIRVLANETFGMQQFDNAKVRQVYADVKSLIPSAYQQYKVEVYAKDVLIDELVLGGHATKALRTWGHIGYDGKAWVSPESRPFDITHGLDGRHMMLWASHGRFYSQEERTWRWQRPRLFCTTEDLLSQTVVVPYLMPMLEHAGAIIASPRERDWQRHEVIVDNDTPSQNGTYAEASGRFDWQPCSLGFAQTKPVYLDRDTPFADGTTRCVEAQNRQSQLSVATWTPLIPADGHYAVYVTYPTTPQSVDDAHYIVRHRGIDTHFNVNQQIGGGTWVYLGTFDFGQGNSPDNCVILTNQSARHGVVTADAVRFGGGMGNIARGVDSLSLSTSGLPRFLEAARYSAQWYGMPYYVYGNKQSGNDYSEDINTRSLMLNYLAGGSDYLPCDTGIHVPIELCLALHTDAGYRPDFSNIGSLGIYTTFPNEGMLSSGLSRLTSRDMCDLVLSQVDADLKATYGQWNRRQMYDRNYSESREPRVPSMILEMLSHQNFADLVKAHDPNFKFTLARAIYKGVLRYVTRMHGEERPCVQPLPVSRLSADIDASERQIHLRWKPVSDPLEPSAEPTAYVVYHSVGHQGFDNGTVVNEPRFTLRHAQTDVLHRFRVEAINSGGASMPSATVCASLSSANAPRVLIIDAFDRLAGPYPLNNDSIQGFDLSTDFGVPMERMPGYCGRQLYFGRDGMGREDNRGLGHSAAELEGIIIAGNTHDWSVRHASDMLQSMSLNIASCTADALDGSELDPASFDLLDVACGLNKADGYSLRQVRAFTPAVRQAIAAVARAGGSVLVSGAYIGSDMTDDDSRVFTRSILKYEYAGALPADSIENLTSWDSSFTIFLRPNETSYCLSAADKLAPIEPGFCPVVFAPSGLSAAVAYQGNDYRTMSLGFPLESIEEPEQRAHMMQSILNFLLNR